MTINLTPTKTQSTPQLFDVIVGNPPYGVNFDDKTKYYLHKKYPDVPDYEIYMYFIRQGLDLLTDGGILSYIFPNTFLSINNGIDLREWLLDNYDILRITDLSNDKTFEDAAVRTCIFTIRKTRTYDNITEFWDIESAEKKFYKKSEFSRIQLKENVSNWLVLFCYSISNQNIINKMKSTIKLSELCEISQGLIPYDKYRGYSEETIKNRIWHSDKKLDETYKKELKGVDIEKYSVNWNNKLWISYGKWLAAPRNPIFFNSPRVLIREIAENTLFCGYTENEYYNTPSIINVISTENNKALLKFILGVLNTKIIGWYHKNTSPKANKGLFPKILVNDVRNLPIPNATTEQQTEIANLVDQIMDLKTQYSKYLDNTFTLLQAELAGSNLTSPTINRTKNLTKFTELDFTTLLTELIKQKYVITRATKRTLLESFEIDKSKLVELQKKIDAVDDEIEAFVRVLYGVVSEF